MCFEVKFKKNCFQCFLNTLRQIKHAGVIVFGINLNLVSFFFHIGEQK